MEEEQNSDKSETTRDAGFKISISSEDINKIEEKIRNEDIDVKIQKNNNNIISVILLNTCTNCGIKFVPKNSMIYETLCGSCIEKKATETDDDRNDF